MGCVGPKSSITVRDDKTFLDLCVRQLEVIFDPPANDLAMFECSLSYVRMCVCVCVCVCIGVCVYSCFVSSLGSFSGSFSINDLN